MLINFEKNDVVWKVPEDFWKKNSKPECYLVMHGISYNYDPNVQSKPILHVYSDRTGFVYLNPDDVFFSKQPTIRASRAKFSFYRIKNEDNIGQVMTRRILRAFH